MNSDDLRHGTIIVSEDQRHVLHRLTITGRPAPTGMLASIPDEDHPDQLVEIRSIVIAVLWEAVLDGEVEVLEYGPVPRRKPAAPRPSIESLMREGMVFYGSKLAIPPDRGARRIRPTSKRNGTAAGQKRPPAVDRLPSEVSRSRRNRHDRP